MKQPEAVRLSREDGEAVLVRLAAKTLTAEDRRVLGKVRTVYLWRRVALREAKLRLQRGKAVVVGEPPKKRAPPEWGGSARRGGGGTSAPPRGAPAVPPSSESVPRKDKPRPPGHGRPAADGSRAAQRGACRHEE